MNLRPGIENIWENELLAKLEDYIKIPAKSPLYDKNWKAHGYIDQAAQFVREWCENQPIQGKKVSLLEIEGRTPFLMIEVAAFNTKSSDNTIFMYGHIDKQPEMTGWDKDKGPWIPKRIGDKLYGRGGGDDGYAVFSALTALRVLQEQNLPHPRTVVLIEASEESGSPDLPYYIEKIKDQIGEPKLVICLDSGCGNYETLWSTTSLRGLARGTLKIKILDEGVHSGTGSGIVPSWQSVLYQLLSRIEDLSTGTIHHKALTVEIPEFSKKAAAKTAEILGQQIVSDYPFAGKAGPIHEDLATLLLNRTWRPALTITGIDGVPGTENAANVTIPEISVKLSIRLPPTQNSEKVLADLKNIFETTPPYGTSVSFSDLVGADGWIAPSLAAWLDKASEEISMQVFGNPVAYHGEGGTIPFMGMLGRAYPNAQFLITGVLGPHSNAHGPNEFLHIPMAKKLTEAVCLFLTKLA